MTRKSSIVVNVMKNRPWDVIPGDPFKVRIWENELGRGRSELRADFVRVSDGRYTQSFSLEEMESLQKGCREAIRRMRKHQRRRLWLSVMFRW